MKYFCPFCKKSVRDEVSSIRGCKACIDDWRKHGRVDHPVE